MAFRLRDWGVFEWHLQRLMNEREIAGGGIFRLMVKGDLWCPARLG